MKRFSVYQYALLIFASILVCTFLISFIWEFALEEFLISGHREESNDDRWEYVVTSTAFSLISLIPAFIFSRSLLSRLLRSKERGQMADYALLNTNGAVLMVNPSLEITFANTAFTTLIGVSEEQLKGHRITVFGDNSEQNFFSYNVWDNLDKGKSWQGEFQRNDETELHYHVKANINPIRKDDGVTLGYVALISDVTDMKNEEKKLHLLAHYDFLTKLPNRLLLEARFEHSVEFAQRNGCKLGLLFLDVDDFKGINDNYGHYFADKLLRELAMRLNAAVRNQDTVSRVGGDEFIVVVHEVTNRASLDAVIEKLSLLIELPYNIEGKSLSMGVSIGVSMYPDQGVTLDELAKSADTEMYKAKHNKFKRVSAHF